MSPSTIDNTAAALRLAARGVTPSQLAAECGIRRQAAYAILRRLVEIGELQREGGVGRGGHVYTSRNSFWSKFGCWRELESAIVKCDQCGHEDQGAEFLSAYDDSGLYLRCRSCSKTWRVVSR